MRTAALIASTQPPVVAKPAADFARNARSEIEPATAAVPPLSAARDGGTAMDWVERIAVVTLYGWMVVRLLQGAVTDGALANLLLLPSEGLVVFFMLIRRRASDVSRRSGEWLLAFSATATPLLVTTGIGRNLVPVPVGAGFLLMGMIVQLHAKLTLGRSFGCVPAHRGVKIGGPYRFVRHPMYGGYLLSHLAFLAMNPTLWNLAVYVLCYCLQIPRLLAEERLLSRDAGYRAYQAAVRYRLVPGLF
ncbi:MAG: isoprenylcysteine carboxylmethyltransferase family protein [Planctomycetes bacterium]|nr:isoprenylcysteine carboxylmethyltransferase family protein [Planctomycetota bacterium]